MDTLLRIASTRRVPGFSIFIRLFLCGVLSVLWAPILWAQTATTTSLAVTAGGSAVTTVASGTPVTLTATVQAGATAIITGQVNFCDASASYCTDIHVLGTAQLTSAGTATLSFYPGIGSHSYKAVFVGTSSDGGSTSSNANLTVTGRYPTVTTISQSGSAGSYTLTATVTGTGSSSVAPTGTVSFLDTNNSNYMLGSTSLGAGAFALSFTNSSSPGTGSNPRSVAVGDFNGDGKADLAVADYSGNDVTILLGNEDGTFSATDNRPGTGNFPISLAIGDFNGDGKADLAVANANSNDVTILLGNGDGTFTATGNSPGTDTNPRSVAVGDFNGDGKTDLVVANYTSNDVTILLGNGDGTFTATANSPATGISPYSVAIGDFNGDGRADLAVANDIGKNVTILLGNGDGTFTATGNSPGTDTNPRSVAVGDFNEDGKADLAVADYSGNDVTILLGNGDGTFTVTANSPVVGANPTSVAVGDFNGDGKADLATSNIAGDRVSILLGSGDGTFTVITNAGNPLITGTTPESVVIGDFNGDGKADLATANFNSNSVTVALMDPTATATATVSSISPVGSSSTTHAVQASYSGDTLYVASTSGTTALTAEPENTTLTLAASPSSSNFSHQVALTATLSPYIAQSISTDGETVTFYNGSTSLGTVTLSSGVATLNITSLPVGTDALTAVYGGDPNLNSSTSNTLNFIVSPPPATTLAITANGSTVTSIASGTMVTLTATVQSGATAITSGQVNFCDATASYCTDIHLLGTAQLTSAGTATLKLQPGIGSHNYKAVFVGTATYVGSTSSTASLMVTGMYATTTSIAQSGSAGNYTLTATVVGSGSIAASPIGTVSFRDTTNSNYLLGSASLGTGMLAQGFLPQVSYTTGSHPGSVAVGDFNGDGIPDLAVTNNLSNNVSVLLGNGDGSFQSQASYMTGNSPTSVAVGDFNGDGIPDLAVANPGSGNVGVLLGKGDGSFQSQVSYTTGGQAASVAVGDFNGDGIPDLAVVNIGSSNVAVLLGKRDGSFQSQVSYMTGSFPTTVTIGDFNGDGIPDLAVANQGSNNVSVLLGKGDGSFQSQVSYTTGGQVASVAVGDFNGDGIPDLAVANFSSNNVGVLPGQWTETVTASATGVSPAGNSAHAVEAIYAGDTNYSSSTSNTTSLTAQPVTTTLTLTANSAGIIYGQQVTLTATIYPYSMQDYSTNGETVTFYNGSTSLGTVTLNSGVATLNVTSLPVGTDRLTASYVGDSNFTSSTSPATLTVSKGTPTIATPPTASGITYGQTLSSSTLSGGMASYNGIGVAGVFTWTTSTTAPAAGMQTESITFTPADTTNYNIVSGTVAVTVNKMTPTVTWSAPAVVTYGTALSPTQLNATASIAGSFDYTPAAGTVLTAGTHMLSVTFTPTDNLNYSATTATVTITVSQAMPMLNWTAPAAIVYGTALTASQLNATANVAGAFVYSPAVGTVLNAGSQTLSVNFTPTDTTDYKSATATTMFMIDKAVPTATLSANVDTIAPTQSVTLTGTVASAAGRPSGIMSFYDGSILLGIGPVTNSQASYTVSSLSTGSHTITAVYSGDGNFTGATAAGVSVTVDSQDFNITPISGGSGSSDTTQTVMPGGSASYGFQLAPVSGNFSLPVTFSVSGLPEGATYSFNPSSLPEGSTGGNVMLTIQLAKTTTTSALRHYQGEAFLALLLLPLLSPRRMRLGSTGLLMLWLAFSVSLLALSGCGASGVFTQVPKSYTVSVTATSGTVQHATNLTLNVQ